MPKPPKLRKFAVATAVVRSGIVDSIDIDFVKAPNAEIAEKWVEKFTARSLSDEEPDDEFSDVEDVKISAEMVKPEARFRIVKKAPKEKED